MEIVKGQYPTLVPQPSPLPQLPPQPQPQTYPSSGPVAPVAPQPPPQPLPPPPVSNSYSAGPAVPPPVPQRPYVPPVSGPGPGPGPASYPSPVPRPYQPPPAPAPQPRPYVPVPALPPPRPYVPVPALPPPQVGGGYGGGGPLPTRPPIIQPTPFYPPATPTRRPIVFATTPQQPRNTYIPSPRGPTTTPNYWWVTNGGNRPGGQCCPQSPAPCCQQPRPPCCRQGRRRRLREVLGQTVTRDEDDQLSGCHSDFIQSRCRDSVGTLSVTVQPLEEEKDDKEDIKASGCGWDFLQSRCRDITLQCDGSCQNLGNAIFSDCRCITNFGKKKK